MSERSRNLADDPFGAGTIRASLDENVSAINSTGLPQDSDPETFPIEASDDTPGSASLSDCRYSGRRPHGDRNLGSL